MTTVDITQHPRSRSREELAARADELGRRIAPYARAHDRDGTFVAEAYEILRSEGRLALAVPRELGGDDATVRDVATVQRTLAHHCAATALASSMHHHVVLAAAWRYRHGAPGADRMLRRVAEEGLVLVSTGGADQTRPRGTARKVPGGYRVDGRKVFCSQAPVGDVLATMFPFDDPDEGRIVLNMMVPMNADGVRVLDTWDSLGMRGTGSHDVELTDVFVPDAAVVARRPYGVIDPPFQLVLSVAMPVVAAVYLGVAEAAHATATALVAGTPRAGDPIVRRQLGVAATRLQVASWALDGALDVVGGDPVPSMTTVAAVMTAKAEIARAAIEVCDLALDVAGGRGFYRSSPLEQCYRDVRGVKFHPLTPEETLLLAGAQAIESAAATAIPRSA
ncbi:acyl-CoA/acyl-ACP dehydrogenase [Rhodococcus sp. 14C212]|uniref:acyl-CoA dehydrogenase family protein n=1 Tax=Rhodococcus sp. 14C212 TaxID=2711209 RepID=UPI0013EC94B3|nr:acyl-CoA dehydrogenase family protein [Rhodococcus sp. 14C212]NGP07431.1 acyl-CoA/acyl-ACP dehydrogenase [Rhodococcus sp. 14C212]